MISIILALNIISVFILTLACAATVRFVYRSEPIIIIDFLFFQIILFPARHRKKSKKRAAGKIKQAIKNISATKKAFDFLFRHSVITVHDLDVHTQEDDPAKITIYKGYINARICALFAYLRIKSLNLKNYAQLFTPPRQNTVDSPTIDITLFTSLHVIAFSLIIFFKDIRKRERKIVGN